MLGIKRLTAMILMALMLSLCAPQAFAGIMDTPAATGEISTPGATDGTAESPGYKRDGVAESPGYQMRLTSAGDIGFPGLDGWIGTGLYAGIASLVV
jgi:hypothetical protein